MIERIDDLIVLAAIGELTAAEARELDDAAAADPEVAAQLAADLDTAAALSEAVATPPPAGLRSEVLAAVARTPQGDRHEYASDRDHDQRPDADGDPSGQASGATSLSAVRRRRSRRLWPTLAAAAVLVLVAAASIVLIDGRGAEAPDEFAAVTQADDAEQRVFDGDLSGSLRVIHSASVDAIVIAGELLPTVAADRAYVLWFLTDDEAIPVGQFRPGPDGDVEVRVDGVDPAGMQLGITEEPITGSETPTPPILATA